MADPGDRQAPDIEYDYTRMAIRIDTRGMARLGGTLRFADLEPLPRVSGTFLMQCGAPNPRGIVKWTGVRFSDFADILGLLPEVHYCRVLGSDGRYADESLETLRHPQVMLAWMMNDEPIAPRHRRAASPCYSFPVRDPEHQGHYRDDLLVARSTRAGVGALRPLREAHRPALVREVEKGMAVELTRRIKRARGHGPERC